jgi:hypothetical protein
MKTFISVFLSGVISLIVSILGTEYRFRKRDLRRWECNISSLITDIESNIDSSNNTISNKSNTWQRECSELINNCPSYANEKTLEYLKDLLEECESVSNMNPVPGGYNDDFNNKKDKIESISEDIKENIR